MKLAGDGGVLAVLPLRGVKTLAEDRKVLQKIGELLLQDVG